MTVLKQEGLLKIASFGSPHAWCVAGKHWRRSDTFHKHLDLESWFLQALCECSVRRGQNNNIKSGQPGINLEKRGGKGALHGDSFFSFEVKNLAAFHFTPCLSVYKVSCPTHERQRSTFVSSGVYTESLFLGKVHLQFAQHPWRFSASAECCAELSILNWSCTAAPKDGTPPGD